MQSFTDDPASYNTERIYAELIGPLGAEPTVWAECAFVDLADLAVLCSPAPIASHSILPNRGWLVHPNARATRPSITANAHRSKEQGYR
jgi:hypothetical protein